MVYEIHNVHDHIIDNYHSTLAGFAYFRPTRKPFERNVISSAKLFLR
jgi:hypothetical protein